jgi:hypothetical protein
MGTIAKQLQMEKGMTYTLLRARTAQVTYNQTQTTLTSTGLLAGQNPSVVVVGFYPTYSTIQQLENHSFNSISNITNLYIRCGGMRIPSNYDYERPDNITKAMSLVDYNEYVLACKASSHNSSLSDNENPLISYEAYQTLSFFVFNCKQNQETMWGRDDSSNSKGGVDVYARFPAGQANFQATMIVIGLCHDQVHITHDGKVNRIGW